MTPVPRNPALGPLYIWNDHVPVANGWPKYQYHEREQVRSWDWAAEAWVNRAIPAEILPAAKVMSQEEALDRVQNMSLPPGIIYVVGPTEMMVHRYSTGMLNSQGRPLDVLGATRRAFLAAPPGHILVAWDAYPWLLGLVWSNEPFVGQREGWPKHEVSYDSLLDPGVVREAIRADLEADLLPLEGIPWWERLG